MLYFLLCIAVLFFSYLINITYVSVFYHRGLTHRALRFPKWFEKFIVSTGPWMTGLDPMPWCCMHRMHHLYSDTEKDPHSPKNVGILGVLVAQKNNYCKATWGLIRKEPEYINLVTDLDFPVNWMSRTELWWLPYVLHGVITIAIGVFFHAWLLGIAYYIGIMSHPLQGWMVNSLGHHSGYRNFNTPDESKNNILVSLLVMGEGYQNNHHQKPTSANFGSKKWEIDFGYVICWFGEKIGLFRQAT